MVLLLVFFESAWILLHASFFQFTRTAIFSPGTVHDGTDCVNERDSSNPDDLLDLQDSVFEFQRLTFEAFEGVSSLLQMGA